MAVMPEDGLVHSAGPMPLLLTTAAAAKGLLPPNPLAGEERQKLSYYLTQVTSSPV